MDCPVCGEEIILVKVEKKINFYRMPCGSSPYSPVDLTEQYFKCFSCGLKYDPIPHSYIIQYDEDYYVSSMEEK